MYFNHFKNLLIPILKLKYIFESNQYIKINLNCTYINITMKNTGNNLF